MMNNVSQCSVTAFANKQWEVNSQNIFHEQNAETEITITNMYTSTAFWIREFFPETKEKIHKI